MTDKLYYKDAYIKEFEACVLSCEESCGMFSVVLDRTAFFPEEGGQSADSGTVAGICVSDVKERLGVIYHYLCAPVNVGDRVLCSIDFDKRFDKMQQHTAEHMLSGIIHRLYGFENVGFHLGDTEVTFDIDGTLTREELFEVERLANDAVCDNRAVYTFFPSSDELSSLTYRSKLDLSENVRIVDIDGVDVCACCAPHVSHTGEVGCIKILDFMKWRGGLRINIAAGSRALADYNEKYDSVKNISALLSAPKSEVYDAVSQLLKSYEAEKGKIKELYLSLASMRAELVKHTDGNCVELFDNVPMDALIAFSNAARGKVSGMLVAISGTGTDYKYVISSNSLKLSSMAKEINSALCGKGGGRDNMIQGSFNTDLDSILAYFGNIT